MTTAQNQFRRVKTDTDDELHYALVGSAGAAHFHYFTNYPRGFLGGVECHSTTKLDYLGDGAKHEKCWILGTPCWHDGSSLMADEYRDILHDDEAIYEKLESTYRNWFGDREVESGSDAMIKAREVSND